MFHVVFTNWMQKLRGCAYKFLNRKEQRFEFTRTIQEKIHNFGKNNDFRIIYDHTITSEQSERSFY